QWLKYYYDAWFNSKPISILSELIQYKQGIDLYDTKSFMHFGGNLVDFLESTEGVGPELAQVAIRIHGICVNSASVEYLWLFIGLLHTSRQNRDIFHTRKIKNSKEYDNCIRRLHIAAPISSDDESSEELTIPDLDYQVSDNESESNIDEAITGTSNVEKVAPGSNTESGNIKEATTKSSNWMNQNFEDEVLITEKEQQWENTINE
ncbi:2093_t:CDS:2, partial [Dentiscutata erythropus]